MLCITDAWKQQHQGASLGVMIVKNLADVENNLEECKRKLEAKLRTVFARKEELSESFPLVIYGQYYKRYKKTYHVLQQLESVVFKNKSIPCVSPIVEAMFMAELKNGLLTAGHDHDALQFPLTLDAALGNETYTLLNGKEQIVKAQDMVLYDSAGIISSIIYGPDLRTRMLPETSHAVYTVYAPEGISQDRVINHLSDIYEYVSLACPKAKVEWQKVYS